MFYRQPIVIAVSSTLTIPSNTTALPAAKRQARNQSNEHDENGYPVNDWWVILGQIEIIPDPAHGYQDTYPPQRFL
jgi:hypothetical protein